MKRILIISLFIFSSFFSYGAELNQIRNLTTKVSESLKINGKEKKSKYNLFYIFPNFMRKEIIEPKFNKGEIYIYNQDKKIVYLPLFEQTTEEEIKDNENDILNTIKFILNKEKEDEKFKNDYYSKKVENIVLENNTLIKIDKLKMFNGYLLPTIFKIYDGDILVAELKIENYEVNSDIRIEELSKI